MVQYHHSTVTVNVIAARISSDLIQYRNDCVPSHRQDAFVPIQPFSVHFLVPAANRVLLRGRYLSREDREFDLVVLDL